MEVVKVVMCDGDEKEGVGFIGPHGRLVRLEGARGVVGMNEQME